MIVPDAPPPPTHEVRTEYRGRFLLPCCSCGWQGTARLSIAAAREEARDHSLLYAGSITSRDDEPGPAGPGPTG